MTSYNHSVVSRQMGEICGGKYMDSKLDKTVGEPDSYCDTKIENNIKDHALKYNNINCT